MIIFVVFGILYIIIGAAIGSLLYYLQLKQDSRDRDADAAISIGVFWPVASPFAFGLYLAEKLSKRDDKK